MSEGPGQHGRGVVFPGVVIGLSIAGLALVVTLAVGNGTGNAAEWVAAAATVAAVIAAVYAGIWAKEAAATARSTYEIEARRDAATELQRRMEQAAAVVVRSVDFLQYDIARQNEVDVINASSLPIFNVLATAEARHVDNQTGLPVLSSAIGHKETIFPTGETPLRLVLTPPSQRRISLAARAESPIGWRVTLEFTDAAGGRWRRYESGVLEELRRAAPVQGSDPVL